MRHRWKALAVAAAGAAGLALSPASAFAEPLAPGLNAWHGAPGGDPDRVFSGFECQNTDYRYTAYRVINDGPPQLWMSYYDPECEKPMGFFDPGSGPEIRPGVGSVQRWR